MANTSNKFNISSEQSIANRISMYDLSADEKSAIWQKVEQRNEDIAKENKDFKKEYLDRYNKEVENLKAGQSPFLRYNHPHDSQNLTGEQIRTLADRAVKKNHSNRISQLHNQTDQYIDSTLDKALDDNRGPKTLTSEFNKNANNEPDLNNDLNKD